MQKMVSAVIVQIAAAAMILVSQASAQQSPAASSKASSSQTGTAAKAAAKKPTTTSKAAPAAILRTQKQKSSYALGMSVALGMRRQGVDADPAMVARGLRDQLSGSKTLMTEDEMKAALQQLQGEMMKERQAKAQAAGDTNRKAGDAFLAANKSKPGVTTLPDGLQYKVLKEGTGPKPTANDTVTVNYRGTLISGKEFDSSYKRGQPASFRVGGVIKGWTEALQLMPVGSKWELYIPTELAYGDRPPSPDIAPGDMLIFEVELLSIGESK
jgi:FKBP-type peptidyl-prolyl cis-trans isomerase